jgi:hypothetical protein
MSYFDAAISNDIQYIIDMLESNPCATCVVKHLLDVEYTTIEAVLSGELPPDIAIDIHNAVCYALIDVITKGAFGGEVEKDVIKQLREVLDSLNRATIEHSPETSSSQESIAAATSS